MAVKCPKCQFENPTETRFCGNCAAPLTSVQGIVVSKTMTVVQSAEVIDKGSLLGGKYRVLEEIGRGGMGVVVRAEDTRLKRTVALKFLSPELTANPEARERFIQEARAASALEHPNICTIHEIDEAPDGRLFMAMACYEGESLRDKIKRGKLDCGEALGVAVQVARGLAKAHEKGIVHRDIKPGNIFLTDDGQAKILDFGLAKLAADLRLTRTGATLGTVAYMSPEQAQGQSVDHRTDIWSLGVMLYEMLTGQLPFGGDNEGSLLYSIIHRPARPLRKADPAIPAEIEQVVFKALEKNPADRYQTMADFLSDLEALAEGLKPPKAGLGLFRGRILGVRKPVFYAGAIGLTAVAAFIVLKCLVPSASAGVLDSVAILPIINDSGDPSQDYFSDSLTDMLISELYKVSGLRVSPRQSVMAYKKTTKPVKEIAAELTVKAVFEGSVLKSGNRIRLIGRLVDPFAGRQIWGETLERDYEEILYLQSELCQAIVGGIRVAVNPEERERLAAARKVNPEAYDLVMKASETYWDFSGSAVDQSYKALDYINRAIAIDPGLALAHSWVAFIYWSLGSYSGMDEKETYPKAKEAVLKALELDANLAHARCMLGIIKFEMDWDFAGAEREWRRAAELAPGDWWVMNTVEQSLTKCGKSDDGIALFKRRVEEEEKSQSKKIYRMQGTILYLLAGRYKEALENQKKVMSTIPDPDLTQSFWLADCYAVNGMYSEAVAEIDKIKDLPASLDDTYVCADLAWIWAVSSYREKALKELDKTQSLMAQRHADCSFYAARVYAGLGENDRAFECLYQAYERHSVKMVGLISDYGLRSLHGDPRFEELARKVGFPVIPGPKKN